MRARSLLIAVLSTVVAVAACGGDDAAPTTTGPVVTSTTVTTATTAQATTTAAPPSTTTTIEAPGVEISVSVTGGEVTGDDRYEVGRGEPVTINVEADVEEEVHVHGYDLSADVAPGAPAVIAFTADISGIFEVELEGSGLPLFELVVD